MPAAKTSMRSYTLDEFQRQYPESGGSDQKIVLIIEDGIYDVTDFAASHPGGYNMIHMQHGTDATVDFNAVGHSQDARRLMQSFLIGRIVSAASTTRTEEDGDSTTVMISNATDALVGGPIDVVEEVIHQRDNINDDAAGTSVKLRQAIEYNVHRPHEERIFGFHEEMRATLGQKLEDGATAEVRRKSEAQACQETTRQCYGSWWHMERRKSILATHPEIRKLVEEQHSFVFTIVLGFFAAALHFCVVWNWIPNLLKWASKTPVKATFEYGLLSNPLTALFVDGPFHLLPQEPIASTSADVTALFVLPIVFILAYTVGAWCKMTSFAVGHEIAHEAIHPWISVLGTPQDERGVRFGVRVLLKDLCLRIASLPSVGCTIFEYYQNQHLSHHQHLGGKEFTMNLRRLLDGSQGGDGDMLSVNTLLYKQRFLEAVQYHPALKQDLGYLGPRNPVGITFVMQSMGVVAALQHQNSVVWLTRFFDSHPVLSKVVWDPIYHIGHFVLLFGIVSLQVIVLPIFLFYTFMSIIPHRLRQWLILVAAKCTPKHIAAATKNYTVKTTSWWLAAKSVWPQASVGLQQVISLVLLWVVFKHYQATLGGETNVGPFAVFLLTFLYALLSELFVFGFLFHPFLAYFLAVHRSAYETNEEQGNLDTPCQPTRSIYSTFLSLCCCNLTYHVEHHDFPSLPWYYLPRVKRLAPQWYDDGPKNKALFSVTEVIQTYIYNHGAFTYGCADQYTERFGAPSGTKMIYRS